MSNLWTKVYLWLVANMQFANSWFIIYFALYHFDDGWYDGDRKMIKNQDYDGDRKMTDQDYELWKWQKKSK